MPLIMPFAGLRPLTERAGDVVAPPYDVLTSDEARHRAAGRPCSFLHISKAEIDLPADTDPYSPEVYARSAENFDRLIEEGVLVRDPSPRYYAYRMIMGEHVQTGLVAAASVADYDSNRIRKHEFTRPDKEDDRVRQIEALNAQTGPVLLAYPDSDEADRLIAAATGSSPIADVDADGVRHTTWAIEDAATIAGISRVFEAMPALYIADGHHRSAAASRVAAARHAKNPHHTGGEDYNYFLSVIFPHRQMRIMDYNRVVKDLNGLSAAEFLAALEKSFVVEEKGADIYKPNELHNFSLYLEGKWYSLTAKPGTYDDNDPIGVLDVTISSNLILDEILGIKDLRSDKRIDFVGGIRGLGELSKRVDSGEMKVALALYPVSMKQLMDIADTGNIMPPKTTWFEPKLRSGLVIHKLV